MQHFVRTLLLPLCVLFSLAASAQVTANFSANTTAGCAPLLVQFNNTSTGATTYSWNLGNSTTSVLPNPSTTYTTPGTYTVTLTASNGSQSNTKTMTAYITVYPSPTVNFSASDTAGCSPHPVIFTDQSVLNAAGPGTYLWNFGDGTTGTGQNPSKTFTTPGYYNISVQVTNSQGCSKTLTKSQYIHVYDDPVADFSASNNNPCEAPVTVSFTPQATGISPFTYQWNFGNGQTSTAANPSTLYGANGTYSISLIVTDGHGCKDTIVKPNLINVGLMQANFNHPVNGVCQGSQADFLNTTTPASTGTLWDFGDGTFASSTNATHTYGAAGTYTVKLISYNGPCTDTATKTLVVHPKPDADFTRTPAVPCPPPVTVQYTNTTTNGNTYIWHFGDGTSSTAANPSHYFPGGGLFNDTLIAISAFGCRDTVIKNDFAILPLDLEITADPESGCKPLTVHFTDTAWTSVPAHMEYPYTITSHQWNFGDGTTGSGNDLYHTYNDTGVYYAVVTVTTVNGCTVKDSVKISVGIPPTASFSANPLIVCSSELVHFTNTSTNANFYTWEFGDGGVANSTGDMDYQFMNPGTFTVTLHAYYNGCEDTAVRTAYILVHPPNAVYAENYDCDTPTLVRFTNLSQGTTSQIWYFGDGTSATTFNAEHNYPGMGPYNCMLVTFNNTTGCSDTNTHIIQPVTWTPDFASLDTDICKGDTATFVASIPGAYNSITWILYNNVPYADTTETIIQKYPVSGRYDITLIVEDFHGCDHTVTKPQYQLVSKPEPAFSASPLLGCVPLPVTFTDQSTNVPGVATASRKWSFGNGASLTNNNGSSSYTYNAAGLYDIKLVVTDAVGCKDSLTKTAYVEARKPVAAFNANDTSACIGQMLTFANTSSGATSLSYQWSFGDNTTSTAAIPQHAYTQSGVYTVRLIATDLSGCKDTLTRTNYISVTKPDAAFTMSDTMAICPPLMIQFTNASTQAVSYQWAFGNGNSSVLPNPSNSYTNPGQYTIRLIAKDLQGCTDTAYRQAKVLGYAGALSYSPLTGCAPLSVNFTANLTNVPSVIWDFSDGVTAPVNGSNTTTHVYATPGAYVPKLIISDGQGCLNSSLGLDTIKVDGVIASFTTGPVCVNTPTLFQDNSTLYFSPAAGWQWTFSNGQTSALQQPSFTYSAAGSYPVTLVVTNANGCKDTVTQNVTVHTLPTIAAGADTTICVGDQAQLQATGGSTYVWSPAAGLNNPNTASPLAGPAVATLYTVTGTDANGCKNKDDVRVSLQTKTTSAAGPDTSVCFGSSVQLYASGAHHYQWSPAATLSQADVASPFASPTATTMYMVVAKEGSCAPDTHKVRVVVHPKPEVNAGSDKTIVAGTSVVLNAIGTNTSTFTWSPAATLSCSTCSDPTATPLQTTEYSVLGENEYGCRDTDVVVVRIICNESQVFIPNTFTPNGDGQNDVFYPHGSGLDLVKSFRVYNRWGQLVFEKNNFQVNDKSMGWDGLFNGKEQAPDVYVYVMEAVCENGEPINWKGDVALIR